MKSLKSLLKRNYLPSWLKCLRTVWMLGIVVAFILGYAMGMYEEDVTSGNSSDDMIADVRENPMVYHEAQEEEYGFHRRKI